MSTAPRPVKFWKLSAMLPDTAEITLDKYQTTKILRALEFYRESLRDKDSDNIMDKYEEIIDIFSAQSCHRLTR